MDSVEQIQQKAKILRSRIITTSHKAGMPHLGSCLSCVEILATLYFSVLNIDPKEPRSSKRDRFILSKGHAAPALFQVLAMRGFYPEEWLDEYGKDGGVFAEHPPTPDYLAGIEAATGSLGHGMPMGLGMALATRITKEKYNVYALLSDGECNEGSIWEAAMFAGGKKVSNLCVIVDFNKWQATDRSQEVLALNPLADKWRVFGWDTIEVDGHDVTALQECFRNFPSSSGKPTAIIAHTVKGKGVSFMEDDNNWHYRIPTEKEVEQSNIELGINL